MSVEVLGRAKALCTDAGKEATAASRKPGASASSASVSWEALGHGPPPRTLSPGTVIEGRLAITSAEFFTLEVRATLFPKKKRQACS